MTINSPALLGAARGLGFVVLMAVLTYLGDASHLSGLVSTSLASLIAIVALAVEHSMAAGSDTALFGAIKTR